MTSEKQQAYQGLTQQAQDVASYDISQAYANYKQQQLQLQMNEQLGAGFQQQAGQQLQSAYGSAYAGIKTQEAETLGKIASQEASVITAGEKEVHAWTCSANTKAPQAAGVIHTDFEKGFIRAEVTSYKDFVECGSYTACKEKGVTRLEGKDYIVQDGDIVHFRFAV